MWRGRSGEGGGVVSVRGHMTPFTALKSVKLPLVKVWGDLGRVAEGSADQANAKAKAKAKGVALFFPRSGPLRGGMFDLWFLIEMVSAVCEPAEVAE